ncbi:general substrate transporter [Exophiala viscosa]|uniref:general substrate transporter n=1 Tax=Exophiala viscosa TaxID=2486360 RepID=UPI00219CA724|nr:general substrate transporter [Exophiala viscosa]
MEEGTPVARPRLTTIWEEKRIIAICLCIAFAQFQYGYDSAAVSGFQSMPGFLRVYGYPDPATTIGYNISTSVQRLIQSLMNVGGLAASIFVYSIGDRISRRTGLWIACLIGVIAISIQIASKHTGALYAGRLLLGLSNGFFIPYSVTYMSEVSPAHLRGSIVGMVVFQISLGALFGILVDNYTDVYLQRKSYEIPLGVMYIIPAFISVFIIFLPDTPRYYISRGQDDKAANSIRKTRGITDQARIAAEVADIKSTWLAEQELHNGVHLRDMIRGPDLRRTLISLGAAVGQTATGITFISGYSVYFYVQARIGSPFIWVMVGLALTLTANMASFPAMRYLSRRFLLLSTSIASTIFMLAMAIVYTKSTVGSDSAGKALVGISIVYTWFYGVGQGPVLWAVAAEVPSQRLRATTVGVAAGSNFVFGWLCQFCTPYFINPDSLNWGPKYGYIWGGSNAILTLWIFFFVPETKGRSLEQLDELFENRVPTWKFSQYVTEHVAVDAEREAVPVAAKGGAVHVEDTLYREVK